VLTEFLRVFKKPTATILAQTELEEAQRQLLAAQSGLDFARSSVEYNQQRVARLTRYVRTGEYDAGTPAVPPLHSDSVGRPDIASTAPDTTRRSPFEAEQAQAVEPTLTTKTEQIAGAISRHISTPLIQREVLAAAPPPALQVAVLTDIEQYQMQMAGISTAALGYWSEGDEIHPDYDTPALRDVARLYVKYDQLFKERVL
jgi:hypothetical protein